MVRTAKPARGNRAMSITELYGKRRSTYRLEGDFAALIGEEIELTGAWFIWGGTNSGKTSLAMLLGKELTKYGRVAYNSLEQKDSLTIVLALKRVRMEEVARRFIFLNAEPLAELKERLSKQKSPDIIIIDSFQHGRYKYEQYIELIELFPRKLFVFISQARGKDPMGSDAESAKYTADVKIRVEGCKAFAQSRYGGHTPFVIWEDRAARYWGDRIDND